MSDKTDPRLDAPGDPSARMNAYYYSFSPTGVGIIDAILSAVATAGKRYHNTESWSDPWDDDEKPQTELIQEAANAAADAIRKHAADTEAESERWQEDWDTAAAQAATVVVSRDATDRASGIVRVDTRDEALVERLAEQMLAQQIEKGFIGEPTVSSLADLPPAYREAWFREARSVLIAVLAAAAGGDR